MQKKPVPPGSIGDILEGGMGTEPGHKEWVQLS